MSLGSKKEKTTSVVEEAADAFVPVSVSETSRDEGGTFLCQSTSFQKTKSIMESIEKIHNYE